MSIEIISRKIYQEYFKEFHKKIYIPKSIDELIANELLNQNNWHFISQYYKLTEEFLNTFKDKVNWKQILKNRSVTLKLIDKFADYIDWNYIMTDFNFNNSDFLISNSYYINWDIYFDCFELPDDFKIDI